MNCVTALQTSRLNLRPFSEHHPENIASRRVAEKNGMMPEKETIFRGFPAIVFGISHKQRSGA